jgi:hypothetical protein
MDVYARATTMARYQVRDKARALTDGPVNDEVLRLAAVHEFQRMGCERWLEP